MRGLHSNTYHQPLLFTQTNGNLSFTKSLGFFHGPEFHSRSSRNLIKVTDWAISTLNTLRKSLLHRSWIQSGKHPISFSGLFFLVAFYWLKRVLVIASEGDYCGPEWKMPYNFTIRYFKEIYLKSIYYSHTLISF